jgi:transposase
MKLFVGLDVSLEKTAICVISEHGKIMREAQAASDPDALTHWISELDGTVTAVGLEAGPLSQWLHRGLTEAGLDIVLMETRQVKGALKAMPIKTDRRDAEGIARLLHLGWFRPVHCKSVSAQEVRAVLNARKAVQQGFIALEMSLRGLLRNFGLKVGTISRGRFEQRIRELTTGNPMLEAAAEPMLRARSSLRQELAGLERRVRQLAQQDPACCRMMSMPGVGAVVALTYRSAVDDPGRFKSSKKVGPWAGLTPSRNQSGERDVSSGITKAGDVNLRRALCQAATVMMHRGRATWLRTWAAQVARRRGSKRAMVALARRIGVILHRMWVEDADFRSNGPTPNVA